VSTGWPAATTWALSHGPVVAGLAALAISPGAHALIAGVMERRLLRARLEFAAVAIGDPLLALAISAGVALSPHGVNAGVRPAVFGLGGVMIACGWLAFGLWQWRTEFRSGYYSRDQAFAPTKIWHQLGVYPLLGLIGCCCVLSGLAAPLGHSAAYRLLGKAVIGAAVLGWTVANIYDRRHPKLGHPPYSWRRLRPVAEPWPSESETLRAYRRVYCQAWDTRGQTKYG
jgi:hypothetical protein